MKAFAEQALLLKLGGRAFHGSRADAEKIRHPLDTWIASTRPAIEALNQSRGDAAIIGGQPGHETEDFQCQQSVDRAFSHG